MPTDDFLSIAQQNARDRDAPVFIARNVLWNQDVAAEWRTTGSWASGSDVTAAGQLTSRASDGKLNEFTSPSDQTSSAYYLMWQLTTPNFFDAVTILGHNWADLNGTVTIRMQIDTVNNFASPTTLFTTAPTINGRYANWDFGAASVTHEDYVYLRLQILSTETFTTMPRVSEVMLGQRRQMGRKGDRPYVERATGSDSERFRAGSGASVDYVHSEGGDVLPRIWRPFDGNDVTIGLDDSQTLVDFWRDCGRGTKAFAYAENPSSDQSGVHWMKASEGSRLEERKVGPNMYAMGISMEEESPFLDPERNP